MFDNFEELEEEYDVDDFHSEAPEGLKEPRHSTFFIGHDDAEQEAISLINSGAMPHAIILSGLEGIGKSTFAFRLARAMLKHGLSDNQDSMFDDAPAELTSLDVAFDDPIFSKVAAGGHPDFLTIERPIDPKKDTRKNNIDVETARKVAPFLRKTASDGGWRVVLIDDANTMNRNAQNAILKILEEPPKNTLLILVTHRLGAMIPTIRSRCRVLNFKPLDNETLTQLMQKEVGSSLNAYDTDILNFLAQGSIGLAHDILQSEGIETAKKIFSLFEQYPDFDWVAIHHLSDQVGRAGQEKTFKNIAHIFNSIFESLCFAKAREQNNLPAPLDAKVYKMLLSRYGLEELAQKHEEVKNHFNQVNFANLDKRQGILAAFNII